MASVATRCELLMEAIDAVHFHCRIDGERHTVEAFATDNTTEALCVIRFTGSAKDLAEQEETSSIVLKGPECTYPVSNGSSASGALFQGVLNTQQDGFVRSVVVHLRCSTIHNRVCFPWSRNAFHADDNHTSYM